MAMTAFCTSCQRTVYVEEGKTPICPVCSTPLVETVDTPEKDTDEAV
jgi:RNA polymerase subunit RPABC4/transcription elongation factor Spt4